MLKGNAVIGQSGGPTSVINSSLAGVIDGADISDYIENIYGMRYGIEGFMNENLIKRQVISEMEKVRETPSNIPYTFDLISDINSTDENLMLIRNGEIIEKLQYRWPQGLYSLSHLAMPMSFNDPLYGNKDAPKSPGIYLGYLSLYGETSVLEISAASLLRQRWNPFHDYTKQRVLEFMKLE